MDKKLAAAFNNRSTATTSGKMKATMAAARKNPSIATKSDKMKQPLQKMFPAEKPPPPPINPTALPTVSSGVSRTIYTKSDPSSKYSSATNVAAVDSGAMGRPIPSTNRGKYNSLATNVALESSDGTGSMGQRVPSANRVYNSATTNVALESSDDSGSMRKPLPEAPTKGGSRRKRKTRSKKRQTRSKRRRT
jgi:hypothetical protein